MIVSPQILSIEERMSQKAKKVYGAEHKIDYDKKVYLITWSPDPKENPEADFEMQHRYHVNTLADYLKYCSCGLFCVESTQLGNPHYHGWYQVSSEFEMLRIVMIKVMQRFGKVKISPCHHPTLDKWSEKMNGMFYYKADLMEEMFDIEINPINALSHDDTHWEACAFFTTDCDKAIIDKISTRQYYRSFYKDSNAGLGRIKKQI